jgi:hypothetical protein
MRCLQAVQDDGPGRRERAPAHLKWLRRDNGGAQVLGRNAEAAALQRWA